MPFRVKDVLIVDATVIIGLLILLTFQSISSSFIESEISAMNKDWRDAKTEYQASLLILEDCKWLMDEEDQLGWGNYGEAFVEWQTQEYVSGEAVKLIESFTPEMEKAFLEKCAETVVKINQDHLKLDAVQQHNYYKFYLSQYDDNDNELSWKDGHYYDYDLWENTKESSYFTTIVTGPLYVNFANVLMIIPFAVSAIIASFNAFRKNEEVNKASRISVFSMGIGFVTMVIGFISIMFAIYEVYFPYI